MINVPHSVSYQWKIFIFGANGSRYIERMDSFTPSSWQSLKLLIVKKKGDIKYETTQENEEKSKMKTKNKRKENGWPIETGHGVHIGRDW